MSEFYSTNADSVKDFMDNYTDKQIEGMEDMSSSLNNQLSLKWRAEFDQAHAKALEEGQVAGEALGGLLGVKGLYKGVTGGYKKLNDIYKKGKDLKKKAEDLKEKVTGKKEEEQDLDDDLEDTDNKIPSNSKGNTEEEGDQDETETTPDTVDDDVDVEKTQGGEGEDEGEFDDLDDFDPQGALNKLKSTLGEEGEGESLISEEAIGQASEQAQSAGFKALEILNKSRIARGEEPLQFPKRKIETEEEDQDETSDIGKESELIGGDEDSVGARVGTEDIGTDIGATEGALNQYASSIASRIASRGANIRQMAQSVFKTVTKYSDGSVKKGSEDADVDDEDVESTEAKTVGEEAVTDTAEEGASLGVDLALGAVPVVGEVALIGTGIYEGIKSLVDIFEPDTPSPPKPKAVGGVLSGGNPLNIGSDGGQASKLTSGIPTSSDVQDVSNSLSF